MKIETLQQSIIFTICYFDVFDYPLTSFEVWNYLFAYRATLDRVILELDELIRHGKIEMKNGFYFLPERSNLVELRQKKYDISEKYWNRAILAAKILSYIPFIKMVAIVNSLAFFNCDEKSDIDFLVISQKEKIWTVRFLSTVLMHFFGLRRHNKKIAKRICLSFYLSEDKLNVDYIARDKMGFFVAFWAAQAAPILSYGQAFENFRSANSWAHQYLPNCGRNITDYYINFKLPPGAKNLRKVLQFLSKAKIVERVLKNIQIKKIKSSQKKWGDPKSVLYNDEILKFHPVDLRTIYKEELEKRLKKYFN